jgi:hypothetical protein
MPIRIAVLRETRSGERRVALVPSVVAKMRRLGVDIAMQSGAGAAVKLPDKAYKDATFVAEMRALVADADIVLAVTAPPVAVAEAMKEGAILISFVYAEKEPELVARLRARKITCFAMERVPRISRAQAMDALTSQATLAGVFVVAARMGAVPGAEAGEMKGRLKPVEASDAAITMRYAGTVIIAPGYGLAAAQTQQKLYELVKLLQAEGVTVKFAIHPVAGRMPGHMDVLLAEAGVPYDLLFELDEINAEFKNADVALVIGANDVVNPAARTNKASPIYGMPILNVDQAHQIYVIKRGQGRGYAGVENELFYADNCNMVYGDAQAVLAKMVQAIKELGEQEAKVPEAA